MRVCVCAVVTSQNDAKLLERLASERRQVLNGVVTAIWELHTDSELAFAEGPMLLRTLGGDVCDGAHAVLCTSTVL